MIIQTNNLTYPDYTILAIEREREKVAWTHDGVIWYELDITPEYEWVNRYEGDRSIGSYEHEWNGLNLSEHDLKTLIQKDYQYRKEQL